MSVLCRREWEDKTAHLGARNDLVAAAGKLSDDVLRKARSVYDSMFKEGKKKQDNGSQQSEVLCDILAMIVVLGTSPCAGISLQEVGIWRNVV